MYLSKDDLQAIKEVINDSVNGKNAITEYRKSIYDRYNRAAESIENSMMLLDITVELVRIHSKQIEELQNKIAQTNNCVLVLSKNWDDEEVCNDE